MAYICINKLPGPDEKFFNIVLLKLPQYFKLYSLAYALGLSQLCSILCSCVRIVLKSDCSIRVYLLVSKRLIFNAVRVHNKYAECSIRVTTNIVSVLLEYIDLFKYFLPSTSYYAGIMLDAFRYLLCSKLCRHNWRKPSMLLPNRSLSESILIRSYIKYYNSQSVP